MTATNHVLTGALIAAAVRNPAAALPLGFLSHFLLDGLPHFGKSKLVIKTSWQFMLFLAADCSAAALTLFFIATFQSAGWAVMFACGVLAASPDLMWLPNYIRALKRVPEKPLGAFGRFHSWIQWGERPWGIAVEAVWFGGGLWLLAHAALRIT